MLIVVTASVAGRTTRFDDGLAITPATVPRNNTQQATQIAPVTAWGGMNMMRSQVTGIDCAATARWSQDPDLGNHSIGDIAEPHPTPGLQPYLLDPFHKHRIAADLTRVVPADDPDPRRA